jgi:hypothetical protein
LINQLEELIYQKKLTKNSLEQFLVITLPNEEVTASHFVTDFLRADSHKNPQGF